jgi:hypothetical protein
MDMGRGMVQRRAEIGYSGAWRPVRSGDFDPAYAIGFLAPGAGDGHVASARVVAVLGAGFLQIQLLAPDGQFDTIELTPAGMCSCGDSPCLHEQLRDQAIALGLQPRQLLDPLPYRLAPSADEYSLELEAGVSWPPEVGPRRLLVYDNGAGWTLTATGASGNELVRVTTQTCSCGREAPCLHQQVVAWLRSTHPARLALVGRRIA